jgi:hypothetical protein
MSVAEIEKAIKKQAEFQMMGLHIDVYPKRPTGIPLMTQRDIFQMNDSK